MNDKRISRRQLLRGVLLGGAGLAAASVVGCNDDDNRTDAPSQSASPVGTATIFPTPVAALATPQWSRISPASPPPPPRRDHSLVTDGRRLYLFGGRNADTLGDLWVYDLESARWAEVTAPGPQPRFGHNAVYAAVGADMLVFGGQAQGFFNDLWTYTPTAGTWQQIPAAAGPSPRYGAAAAGPGEPVIVSHGFTDTGRFDDTWSFGAGSWGELSPSGGPRPIERCLTRAVFDPVSGAFILFGGQTDSNPYLGDTWKFTFSETPAGNAWTEIVTEQAPSPRNLFSMVWDDERQRTLVFGGRAKSGSTNDVWAFDSASGRWSEVATQGEPPSARSGHDAVWLPGRRSMVVFGGQDDGGDRDDLWELDFS
jgi:hypothetical protein